MKFGDFIKQKRIEKGFNLRKFAEMVEIAPAYMSDIENGKRNSPSKEIMEKFALLLSLNNNEINTMNDLAAKDRDSVAPDISNYITSNENIKVALRKAQSLNLGDQEWLKIIEAMDKESNGNK